MGGLTGTSVSYETPYGPGILLNTINSGGVNYWYSSNGGQACSSSTQYTITARVKWTGSSNNPHPNLFYVRQFNSSGGQTSEGGKFSTTNIIPLGDDWYFTYAFFTTDSTAVSFYIHGYEYNGGMKIQIEDLRCRLSGFSDLVNQYNSSLSGTPSIVDNAFRFNTSTFGVIPINLTSGTSTVIVASRYIAGTHGRVLAGHNNYLLGHHSTNPNVFYSEGWVNLETTEAHSTTWRIYAGTHDTGSDTYNFYINGALRASNNGGSQGPNNLQLNGYANQYEFSDCEIGCVMVYNKVLSANEVKNNFNALRNRFGL